MITTDNIGFTGYQSFGGYTADMKSNAGRTLFILSQKQTTIKPTNAVEISWNNETTKKDNGWSIQMTSPQWAVHNRATTGVDWRQRNQVLPGGALYQLSTKDTESTIKIVTYNTLVEENNSRKWIDVSDSSKYTVHSIVENATKFLKEAEETIENFRIVQWVNKNWNAEYAWAGSASDSVKIKDGGESLANLGSQLSASTDDKYRLFDGTTENKNANESDIDIEKKAYTTIVYKGFTDVNGDVYVAWVEVKATTEKLTEAKLKEVVEFLEPLCGTHMNLGGAPSGCTYSGVKNLGNRRQDAGTIVENTRTTYVDLYQMNLKTGWLNNLIDSVERNTGYDDRATWLTPKDGKWYNEAFDGYYMVEQRALYQVGLMMPNKRVAILDPNLCTPKKNKGDIYSDDSTAFLSQFRLDEKSSVRKDKEDGYVGVWNSGDSNVTVILPNLPMMYYSRPFYIPNANVQDLS